MKRIINCETGEVVERELLDEELAQQAIDEVTVQAMQAEAQAKAEAKAQVLAQLGITEEQAKLLLS